jgi:hypothetical protein
MPTTVAVRDETKVKLDRIAASHRWSLIETVDALADSFLESFPDAGLPKGKNGTRRTAPRGNHQSATAA